MAMSDRIPGVPISLGESINVPFGSVLPPMKRQAHGRSTSETGTSSLSHIGNLPPAVSNVPADHVRGYVHSKRVNNYLVGSTLGEGSFAKVKEAFHIQVGEKVAMKVIDKKKAQQDPYVAKNFRREAKLLQMVRHPNILHLMEVIETDTSFYLITELCSGGELMKHIYSKGKLDEGETRKFMRQIISAVDHLHRAGIIHRDLKVENMLLDGNKDLRIIDFGLSNEEFIQGENGKIHCSTQCGSPAYAAPELLGHKKYGPEVDIWSIGVNMYAMLTGCLPYTVEPFNITALHAKMLENKMNPIPESLSTNCKGLLRRLLEANPDQRIKMDEIISHPWINSGYTLPFGPAPFPNRLMFSDINNDIVDHMVHVLKVDATEEDLKQELMTNKATSSACVYFLLSARLKRYQKSYAARKTHVRPKLSRYSQDYDDADDDNKSVQSMPTRRPITRQPRAGHVPLRDKKGREGSGDRTVSHPPLNDVPEGMPTFTHPRRMSLPHSQLSNQMKQFQDYKHRKTSSLTRPKTRQKPTETVEEHEDYLSMSHNEALGPVYPPVKGMSRNYSHGHALNQLRKDLQDKLHPPHTVQTAWNSNPGSRNPSRHGSRIPSSKSSSRHNSMQHGLDEVNVEEELTFHHAEMSKTLPRSFKPNAPLFTLNSPESEDTHLPSLNTRNTHPPHHTLQTDQKTPHRRNGLTRNPTNNVIEITSDRTVEEILTEILRVAGDLKMRESEVQGSTVNCYWKGIRFGLSVTKEKINSCVLKFIWKSNADIQVYKDIRKQLLRKLNLV